MKFFCVFAIYLCLRSLILGSNELEITIFSVGVGNFVLLKQNERALVIDCGGAKKMRNKKNYLMKALSGCVNCKIIISHEHRDHYTAVQILNECLDKVGAQTKDFYYGWAVRKNSNFSNFSGINFMPLDGQTDILKTYLGNSTSIYFCTPFDIPGYARGKDDAGRDKVHPHINNLILGVKYKNTSFIFPGDANQDWFSKNCQEFNKLLKTLEGVDFLLIPHHGSMSDTGFFMKDAIEHFIIDGQINGGKCLLCLISSDPNKGNYYMPRQGVQFLFFICREKVKAHEFSFACVSSFHGTSQNKVIIKRIPVESPIFSTADTNLGYRITSNGNILRMYELGESKKDIENFNSVSLVKLQLVVYRSKK